MDLPTAVLLVVLVALGVMIVIVLEHRLARIRRRRRMTVQDAGQGQPDLEPEQMEVLAKAPAPEEEPEVPAAPTALPADESHAGTTRDPSSIDRLSHVLMQGEAELAHLSTIRLDQPWLDCAFEPTLAFSQFKPLFDRELELLEHSDGTFDQAAFVEQWQRIFGAGLWIRADPEGHHVSQFLLHIHPDGTARLRYG
jgi:hypothetical protein